MDDLEKKALKSGDTPQTAEDVINKPDHYHKNGIDVIGFCEAQFSKDELRGFYRINVLKYVTRYQDKNGVEDLEKAEFYLQKLIELEKDLMMGVVLYESNKII
ncbi:DUF3310 domain-containing protein [Peribacillus simplex]|uniref:DUF3310 domain-containing protein n=1 Tax=Peribacillus simplex TaxID=1478 RepID=UPI0009C04E59|nr:DUF3310 domain-containing protein [Peribacillus simplex]